MSFCPACGAENRPLARFCHQCGQPLALEAAPGVAVAPPTPDAADAADIHSDEDGGVEVEALSSLSPVAPSAFIDEPPPSAMELRTAAAGDDSTPPAAIAAPEDAGGAQPGDAQAFAAASDNDGDEPGHDLPAMAQGRLEVGAIVAGRFLVQEVIAQDDGRVRYRVEDRGVCPACHALIQPSDEEPYCFECGAYVMAPDLPRPQRLLAPILDEKLESIGSDELITVNGEAFLLFAEDAALATAPEIPANPFPRGVQLLVGQRSDVGLARADRPDEDSVFALTLSAIYESRVAPTLGLYFVADGMGGHGDGEIASRLVTETVSTALLQSLIAPVWQGKPLSVETVEALLDNAVQLGNRLVRQEATARGNDMGSTLTLAFLHDAHAYVVNVGDSRTYLWRGGVLQQITEDHSAVFQLFRVGSISEEEIYTHPRRNEITRNMGFRLTVQADFYQLDLLPGDTLLLCCDGLWEMLHNDGIADVFLTSYGDPQQICDELIRRANQAGGDDNISVIVVRVQA